MLLFFAQKDVHSVWSWKQQKRPQNELKALRQKKPTLDVSMQQEEPLNLKESSLIMHYFLLG